jgi:hypothetical protein
MDMLMLLFHGKHKILLSLYSPKISLIFCLLLQVGASTGFCWISLLLNCSSMGETIEWCGFTTMCPWFVKQLWFSLCVIFLVLHLFNRIPLTDSYTWNALPNM